jgi:predicted transcriptional regulator
MRTDIDKIKQDILNHFKERNVGAGHVLSPRWLPFFYLPQLTPTERKAVRPAIEELINEGLLQRVPRSLQLTAKGGDLLYPDEGMAPKDVVKQGILKQFKDMRAKENQVVPSLWLSTLYFSSLNPKQRAVYQEAIKEMIKDGIVALEWNTIKITGKGTEIIYQGNETC